MIKKEYRILLIGLIVSWALLIIIDRYLRQELQPWGGKVPLIGKMDEGWDIAWRERKRRERKTKIGVQKKREKEKPPPEVTAFLAVSKTESAPKIDGFLEEDAWMKSQLLYPFMQWEGEKLASPQTRGYILYDNSNLYVGAYCEEPYMKKLKVKHFEHDGAVWEDDCIEIFISTSSKETPYYQFILNAKGIKYDSKCKSKEKEDWDVGWDGFWVGKTFIGENFWSVEVAIPFSSLGRRKGVREGEVWRMNLNRERYAHRIEYSSWSCTYGGFHTPKRFGKVRFSEQGLMLGVAKIGQDLGENNIVIELAPRSKSLEAILERVYEKKKKTIRKKIPPGQKRTELAYTLPDLKKYTLLLTIQEPSGEIVHCTDRLPVFAPEESFVKEWLILGPFPNPGGRAESSNWKKKYQVDSKGWTWEVKCQGYDYDFLASEGEEINIVPRERSKVVWDTTPFTWKKIKSKTALIDLTSYFTSSEYVVAYAATYIHSDSPQEVQIRLGSDDGYKLWVNHHYVGGLHVHRNSGIDQNIHPVKLKKGKNLILLKIDQDFSAFNFYLRLTDPKGKLLPLDVRSN